MKDEAIAAAAAGVIVPLRQQPDDDVATRWLSLLPSPLLRFYLKLWRFTHYRAHRECVCVCVTVKRLPTLDFSLPFFPSLKV